MAFGYEKGKRIRTVDKQGADLVTKWFYVCLICSLLYLHDYLTVDYGQSDISIIDGGRKSGGRSQGQRVFFATKKVKEIQDHIGNS